MAETTPAPDLHDAPGQELLARVRAQERRMASRARLFRGSVGLIVGGVLLAAVNAAQSGGRGAPPTSLNVLRTASVGVIVLGLLTTLTASILLSVERSRLAKIFKGTPIDQLPTPEPEFGERFGPLSVVDLGPDRLHLARPTPARLVMLGRFAMFMGAIAIIGVATYFLFFRPTTRRGRRFIGAGKIVFLAAVVIPVLARSVALQWVLEPDEEGDQRLTVERSRWFFARHLVDLGRAQLTRLGIEGPGNDLTVWYRDPGALEDTPESKISLLSLGLSPAAPWHARRLMAAITDRMDLSLDT